jgi:lysophospholipase L1-like esterase
MELVVAAIIILASNPPDMSVTVKAGLAHLPSGQHVEFQETKLAFDPPEVVDRTVTAKAPRDYASWFDPWQPWPKKGKDGLANVIELKPQYDEERTQILGGLFRQIDPATVVVTSADGSKTFKRGQDYLLNEEWAQIANLKGGLGKMGEAEVRVTGKMALQRLDLVQVDARGQVSIKKGKSAIVCPALPEPDAGCAALAGIYIAPWKAAANPHFDAAGGLKAATDYAITQHEIFVIKPAPPVGPVNKKAIAKSLKKLADGQELKIAFIGASVTLGAEVPRWDEDYWTEKNLGFPSRVVVELRKRFPKATVTPIEAFKGGTQTKYGLEMIEKVVIPAKADLALIDFGGNDVSGPIGQGPNNPPEQFKEDMRAMIKRAREAGIEVIIVVGERSNPWLKPDVLARWPAYRQAMLDLAKEENVAAADVYAEFANQASRGVPPFSQLHNWINHPGKAGHKLYADVILRFFD